MSLLVFQNVIQYYQTYLGDWVGQQVIRDLRMRLYAHILRLRTSFLNQVPVGQLVTRNISDTEACFV